MTKKERAYEQNLNHLYSNMDDQEVEDSFIYLTVPSRGSHCSVKRLRTAIKAGEMGELIHKFDSILFYIGCNEQ